MEALLTMATGHINPASVYGKRGHLAEAVRRGKAATEQQQRDSHKLLSPGDVAGEYDTKRLLMTTLGGQIRPLTHDDLRTFAAGARKLGKKFKAGITAQGVIDLSLPVDRDRANAQIRTAVVVRSQAGLFHFVTNAGPESDVSRHHVRVEFPGFKAVAAQGQKAVNLARSMLAGNLRFSCDCGRERFWFSYLMTIGGFKYGEPQNNFPRIRNPRLVGVACKHALRVMQAVLKDSAVRTRAAAMIEAAQKNDLKAQTTTAADAKAQAAKQLEQSHHKKNQAEAQADRAKRIGKTAQARARVLFAANKEAARRLAAQRDAGRKSVQTAFDKLKNVPLTKAMRDALIAKLLAAKTID